MIRGWKVGPPCCLASIGRELAVLGRESEGCTLPRLGAGGGAAACATGTGAALLAAGADVISVGPTASSRASPANAAEGAGPDFCSSCSRINSSSFVSRPDLSCCTSSVICACLATASIVLLQAYRNKTLPRGREGPQRHRRPTAITVSSSEGAALTRLRSPDMQQRASCTRSRVQLHPAVGCKISRNRLASCLFWSSLGTTKCKMSCADGNVVSRADGQNC